MTNTVSLPLTGAPVPSWAVTMTSPLRGTPPTVAVKAWEVWPPGMVTVLGTAIPEAAGALRVTLAPPTGAGPLNVSVPVGLSPGDTTGGEKANDTKTEAGGTSQNHISKSPPRFPFPEGNLMSVVVAPAARVPNASPSR